MKMLLHIKKQVSIQFTQYFLHVYTHVFMLWNTFKMSCEVTALITNTF